MVVKYVTAGNRVILRNGAAEMGTRGGSVTSVERSLAILEVLAGNRAGLRLVELAEAIGADRANALRILAAMDERGFVFRDPVSDRYRLTFRVTALGYRQLEAAGVEEWAQPVLNRVAAETQELVRLAAAERNTLHWIARAQGSGGTLIVDPIQGKEVPLHATAAGKAWLALMPENDAIKLVLRQGFTPRTPRTVTTIDGLRAELRVTRERGYGIAVEEADPGILAVAVATVRDGKALGTLSVAAPTTRSTIETLVRWVPPLQRAAGLLAETWGPYVAELIPKHRALVPGAQRPATAV